MGRAEVVYTGKHARQHRYKRKMRARWKANGCCQRCGIPVPINPETGKPFAACIGHRVAEADRQREKYPERARTRHRWAHAQRPCPRRKEYGLATRLRGGPRSSLL